MGKKNINVAIDTGFDGAKIIVNGFIYHVPFQIQDITEETASYTYHRDDANYIRATIDDKTYLVGQVARTYLLSRKKRQAKESNMEVYYTMDRYKMELFRDALYSFIAYGLYRYSMDSITSNKVETFRLAEIGNYDIYCAIALPHQFVSDIVPYCEKYLAPEISLSLQIGSSNPINIKFKIKDTYYNSQVVCAWINEVIDDNGCDIEGNDDPYKKLPALIIDAGYKTVGEFEFGRDESISGDASNMEYAMLNVNRRTAQKISELKQGYCDYMIDELYRKNETVNYFTEDGQVASLSIKKLRDEVFEESAYAFIDHILGKYDQLLDIKSILIAGGSGKFYYPFIRKFCEKERAYLAKNVILANSKHGFMGRPCEPIFAVVCGLYKDMLLQFDTK